MDWKIGAIYLSRVQSLGLHLIQPLVSMTKVQSALLHGTVATAKAVHKDASVPASATVNAHGRSIAAPKTRSICVDEHAIRNRSTNVVTRCRSVPSFTYRSMVRCNSVGSGGCEYQEQRLQHRRRRCAQLHSFVQQGVLPRLARVGVRP